MARFFAVSMVILTFAGILSAEGDPASKIAPELKKMVDVFAAVEQESADPVSLDTAIYDGAIPGMLRTLDPHSSFFDPKAFAKMREDQRGNYYGVGMRGQMRGSAGTMVYEPFRGSPAWKAGLRPGDLIIQVNETNTRGM